MINNDILTNFTLEAAAIIPIITAIVQAFKLTQWVKDKYAPFLAMLVGIGVTFLMAADYAENLSGTILTGLLFGLASSGLYSGLQHTTKILKQEKLEELKRKDQQQKNKNNC